MIEGHGGPHAQVDPPTLAEVLTAPWVSIWRPEEAGRRMALARGWAVLLSLLMASVVAVIGSAPITFWDRITEWHWLSQSPGIVKETHTLAEAWDDWVEYDFTQLPWAVFGTILYVALISVLGAFLVWPRVLFAGKLRPSLDLAGRAVTATSGAFIVLAAAMKVAGVLATDRMYELQLSGAAPWDGRARPDDVLAAVWTGLSWLCAPIWFVWAARAARGARGVLATLEKSPTCEGCGYALTHQSESGRCTECGTELEKSTDPALARPDTPWDRQPSLLSWLETTRLALFHPAKLYRLARVRGDDRRSGAFALLHYLVLAIAVFALNRFVPWRWYLETWTWEMPSVGALNAAAWVLSLAWLAHRMFGMIIMTVATKREWFPPGMQAGKLVDYQVVFLWPLVIVGVSWCLLIEIWPPWAWVAVGITGRPTGLDWIPQFVSSPVMAALLRQAFIWGPPLLLLVFWLRRYGLALRAVRWANF